MSSNEEEYNDTENPSGSLHGSKKRRIQRACDVCRRKKIRCDGGQMPGNRCSNCIAYNFDCMYVEAAKKRGPPKGYVESLENRLEKMEKLLRQLCPDTDFTNELGGNFMLETWAIDKVPPLNPSPLVPSTLASPPINTQPQLTPSQMATSIIRGVGTPLVIPDELFPTDDDFAHVTLADNLKRLSLDPHQYRFFGKSSGAMLIQTAIDLKNEYAAGSDVDIKRPILGAKRPEFWTIRPWERSSSEQRQPDYIFPEDDLIITLTDLYFTRVNLFLPLLHRPTFEKSVAEGLHLNNDSFGETLLLVCAVGSRYSNDPRVLLDDTDSLYSCGWKWFDQVQMVRKSLLAPPCLYDLQFYCLSVQFLQGSSAPQACWTMVGIGIRLAQDVGAHRRKVHTHKYTTEDELWKRAFWVLVCMDRLVSSALGRPCAIQDEDFDLDLPVECDDEYWEHPDPQQAFKQPPTKPSVIAYFNCYLKLNQVLAFSLRTIYSINKSKILLGFVGQQWEQHIVAELDSALNKWIDSVPDHLRWDPNRENQLFFDQSVSLYSSYYQLQILIHRPFIPSPRKPSPLSFPSLAICTNAARSCSHVVDIQRQRGGIPLSHIQMAVFTAGIVLLLNIWGGKRSGLSTDTNKEMADVHKCMQVLQACEQRWHSAGRLWDILYELASVGELPLPQASPTVTNKRERDSDSPISATSVEVSPSNSTFPDGRRSIAGARRISSKDLRAVPRPPVQQPQSQQQSTPHQPQQLFALPMYSDELGRLPLHGQFKFSAQGQAPLESNADYWYSAPASNQMAPPHSNPPPHTPNRTSNMNASAFPMDALFYDQVAPNFTSSFSQTPSTAPHYRLGGDVDGAMSSGVDPRQHAVPSRQAMVDSDTIAMWSNAPTGFELDDWGTYLTNVSELTHGVHTGTGPLGEHSQ